MIIDAKDMVVGRIATVVAKKALLGEEISIVNCEDAIITGKKKSLLETIKKEKDRGTYKGPFIPKLPDRFLKRIIRGMLPYKQDKGKTAYKRIKCYRGVPEEFEGKAITKIEKANVSKMKNLNYVTIKELCKKLGNKRG